MWAGPKVGKPSCSARHKRTPRPPTRGSPASIRVLKSAVASSSNITCDAVKCPLLINASGHGARVE